VERANAWAAAISRAMAWAGGAAFLAVACLIAVDVVLGAVTGQAIQGVNEVSGFVLAVASAWAFAYALVCKAHVRIDSLYLLLPARVRPWLDLVALGTLAFFAMMLTYHAAALFGLSWEFDSRSPSSLQAPLWLPEGLWLLGLAFFAGVCVLLFLRVLAAVAGMGDPKARSLASLEPVDAEIEDELRDAARRKTGS